VLVYVYYRKQVILNHVEAFIIFSTLRRIAATVTSHPLPAAPTICSNSTSNSGTSIAVPAHVHDAAGQQLAISLTGSDTSGEIACHHSITLARTHNCTITCMVHCPAVTYINIAENYYCCCWSLHVILHCCDIFVFV
jgi:hypothetical protein